MPERWHDINNPGKFRKPADEPPPKKPAKEEEPAAAKEPVKPEVRFISGTFEPHPTYGYAINKEAVVKGKAEFIIKTTLRRVTLALHAIYDGSDEDLQIAKKKYGTAEISDDGSFTFSGVPLYCHSKYPLANNKESINTAVHYKAIISHARHEKPLEITIDFPNSGGKSLQTLKRGMHDDKAHNAKPGKYPADPAQGYITGQSIHELQLTLEDYRYLPKGTADGAFGPKTEEAVKAFQADSLKKRRVSRNTGKLMDATSVSYKGQSTGEVESLTRNEMSTWKSEDFLRPLPELHHQDYDQEAVSKRIKPRGGSDFHEVGKPVMERQQDLQKADAYMGYALDGWYGDKMKEAVGLFQDAASKGKFIVNGAATEFEEKLTGFRRGVLDVFSQEYLKKVVEKGGKVPKSAAKNHFPIPNQYRDTGYHAGVRSFGSSRSGGKRAHAGCDLYAPAGTKVYAVADGTVLNYYEFYGQTYAIEIQHNDCIIRYGEVQPPKKNRFGDDGPPSELCNGMAPEIEIDGTIKRGQHIGFVGQLRLLNEKSGKIENYKECMLHIEMYSGKATGNLTDRDNLKYLHVPLRHYQRRDDLLDMTTFLDECDNI